MTILPPPAIKFLTQIEEGVGIYSKAGQLEGKFVVVCALGKSGSNWYRYLLLTLSTAVHR
jgi:hypothetical protein